MNSLPESIIQALDQAVNTNILACLKTELAIQDILDKPNICKIKQPLFQGRIESDIREFTVSIDKSILESQFWWIYGFTSEEDLLDELYINKKECSELFDEATWILHLLGEKKKRERKISLYAEYISIIRRIYDYRYMDREIEKQLDPPSFT